MSFSGRKSCVKGGVFFPILGTRFLGARAPRNTFWPFWSIQGALAYTCCQKCGQLPLATDYLRKVEIWKYGPSLPADPQNGRFVHCGSVYQGV